ncbi:MAG TPA: metalloregulator ArsR/SmtB family transcription factor [Patescibacteria group bacterium]|nr:metalloregulator ArsR/SmtB family transcription factor [Patescibacteria group bacterium]
MQDSIKIERLSHNAAEVTNILRAVSNQKRLQLLCVMAKGKISAGDLAGEISCGQSCTSQHLGYLRRHDLVLTQQEGTTVYYSLSAHTRTLLLNLLPLVPGLFTEKTV